VRPGVRTLARLAILTAVAATLQVAESLAPRPLPWIRLGLANAVALLALQRLGFRAGLTITVARLLLAGLVLGTFGGPAFALSSAGGLLALFAMAAALRGSVPPLSLLGVSVLGSFAHVVGQMAALSALLGAGRGIFALAPLLVSTAIPVGLATGVLVLALDRRLAPWHDAW
jgi:heptaprenyl diphosphate synthase